MNWFLAKTEPGVYSIEQLEKDGHTTWDGVTNAQAVRAIRNMRKGDRVFIYHSGGAAAIVGIAKVISDATDDPQNPKSAVVPLQFDRRLSTPVTLAEIKASGLFADWALVRQSRLSTMAVPGSFIEWMRKEHGLKV